MSRFTSRFGAARFDGQQKEEAEAKQGNAKGNAHRQQQIRPFLVMVETRDRQAGPVVVFRLLHRLFKREIAGEISGGTKPKHVPGRNALHVRLVDILVQIQRVLLGVNAMLNALEHPRQEERHDARRC